MAKSATKYGNKPFWMDQLTGKRYSNPINERCFLWDSELEFSVWMHLKTIVGEDQIERQASIIYKPKGTIYPAQKWKCDFVIHINDDLHIPIEVKGRWILSDKNALSDFHKLLMFLDYHNPEMMSKLLIVSDSWFSVDRHTKTIRVTELGNAIKKTIEVSKNG